MQCISVQVKLVYRTSSSSTCLAHIYVTHSHATTTRRTLQRQQQMSLRRTGGSTVMLARPTTWESGMFTWESGMFTTTTFPRVIIQAPATGTPTPCTWVGHICADVRITGWVHSTTIRISHTRTAGSHGSYTGSNDQPPGTGVAQRSCLGPRTL